MKNVVVIGASNNPEKYGNKIVLDLISKGYNVFPVNPKEEYICDQKVYKNLRDIDIEIDIYDFVVPAFVGLSILKKNKDFLQNKALWFQPGSADNKIEDYLLKNNFSDYKINCCIML